MSTPARTDLLARALRRVRALWAALVARLGRGAPAAAPALPAPAAQSARVLPPAPEPLDAQSARVLPPAPEPPAAQSARAPVPPEVVRVVTPASASLVAVVAEEPPAPAPGEARDALLAGATAELAVLSVRRFFARFAAAAPGGVEVDFAAWHAAPVERFFMAMTSPERTRRREPALSEPVTLGRAFDGFEWD